MSIIMVTVPCYYDDVHDGIRFEQVLAAGHRAARDARRGLDDGLNLRGRLERSAVNGIQPLPRN